MRIVEVGVEDISDWHVECGIEEKADLDCSFSGWGSKGEECLFRICLCTGWHFRTLYMVLSSFFSADAS